LSTDCPSTYYGDPLNRVCTQNCPGNSTVQLFSDTNSNVKMCVYYCPTGYYRQNITGNRTCVTNCLPNYYIDYTNDICTQTCPNGTFSYLNGSCLSACPTPYYADNVLHICDTTCASGKFRDSTTNYCVVQCPPGYFGDITGGYICVKTCSVATQFGNPVSRLCVVASSCSSPYVYADNFTRQCVIQCPSSQNTYGDLGTNACVSNCPWVVGNYLWKDPSTQTCVATCPLNPTLFADNTTKSCVYTCPSSPSNYYAVYATRTC